MVPRMICLVVTAGLHLTFFVQAEFLISFRIPRSIFLVLFALEISDKMSLTFYCCFCQANSEHPLAKAVVGHAKKLHQQYGSYNDHTVEAKDFEVHPGAGVSANIGGKMVLVGNKRLMLAFQVPISPEVQDHMSDTENLARTCVLVAVDGMICGAFAVSDPLKPEAGHVISFLSSMSISSIMVTGDNWATASAIARDLGISAVFAETDPVGKAEKIKELQVSLKY